jgi:hypothetical protein
MNTLDAISEAGGAAFVCDGEEDLRYIEESYPWLT